LPSSPIYDRYQSGDGYHAVLPPYKGTFMPPKPDLVFHTAPNVNATVHTAFNVEISPPKPDNDLHVAPPAVLTKSKLVPITAMRPVNAVAPKPHVTRPRPVKSIVTKSHSPPRGYINRSPSPRASNFRLKVTTVKASMVNVVKGVQGIWEWKPKCPILDHVSRNISASMTFKRFNYNDALGRSKSVMAWVPKRH
nr:hypothetical protein [Tanacetum cinerariifolium]